MREVWKSFEDPSKPNEDSVLLSGIPWLEICDGRGEVLRLDNRVHCIICFAGDESGVILGATIGRNSDARRTNR